MVEFLVVGAGGFIGSCFRFGITKAANSFGVSFPFGTLISNVIAGIIIGFVIGTGQTMSISPKTKLFLTTGLMGGLSTFSTFSLETVVLWGDGKYLFALLNVLLNLALCLSGVVFGMFLAKQLVKKA